ncbi:fasciclin domain-containing protein [Cellulophaga sp. E16_2]|uniref:fasciclin domain-containing protein n=1 Tax=Cellulophaga sp. E16_2 TaxID=2789297 RepID=UPI001A931CE5|nr:fasciclin domain-containing protein [Cellulophaga sp. E16_2]MBO0591384.1 fasciclin domain-containing protein [Cellulophaga sp. E16_2]
MKTIAIIKSVSLTVAFMTVSLSMAQDMSMAKDKKMNVETKMVGGAEMFPSKDIVSNAVNSKDHTTLVAAVKAADLVTTLQGEGPFTVFAPTNAAFEKLPKGTVNNLLMMENKEKLQGILTYHVLAGKYAAKDIMKAVNKGKGKAEFKTVNGGVLKVMLDGDTIKIIDGTGHMGTVTIADVNQSNGVIHVIDTVVLPGM